jgi:hypothetical protein
VEDSIATVLVLLEWACFGLGLSCLTSRVAYHYQSLSFEASKLSVQIDSIKAMVPPFKSKVRGSHN